MVNDKESRVDSDQPQTGRPAGSTAASHEVPRSYDDKQLGATLRQCARCGRTRWFTDSRQEHCGVCTVQW